MSADEVPLLPLIRLVAARQYPKKIFILPEVLFIPSLDGYL